MRDDHDRLLSQVLILTTDVMQYKESTEKYSAEMDILTAKANKLEVDFPVSVAFIAYSFLKILMALLLKGEAREMSVFFYS